jgi:adapter protein MecA 1/2
MRIEKLNENKIRIFLGIEDLREKNIDLHDFMSNSLESQDLFLDLLTKAEAEVGFKTHNYKLLIEALASSDGNFIFTITRTKPDGSQKLKENKPKAKRYTTTPNKALSIYSFNTFDEFCEFCNYIQTSNLNKFIDKLKNSSLVLYKGTYYLILSNLRLNVTDLKSFSYTISEFSSRVKNEELLERKLKEYGKVIISKNAIATCLKYFK